ncbi:MAG: PilZ domain-containing protein [Candidatus Brocadiaceae bacterium]|nr:PilZ domain-containing protein [Candidatus Brocadiaceae bacterium]
MRRKSPKDRYQEKTGSSQVTTGEISSGMSTVGRDNSMTLRERRKSSRIKINLPFEFDFGGVVIAARGLYLSCSGVYCEAETHVPFMTKLRLMVVLPGKKEKIECCGVVVRVDEFFSETHKKMMYKLAIYFDEIGDSERGKIASYISSCKE